MNPTDAEDADFAEDDTVRMTSPYGTVKLPLKLDASLKRGYLFAPIHFSKPNFNSLMSAVPIDPKARMPALKVVPVKVERQNEGFKQNFDFSGRLLNPIITLRTLPLSVSTASASKVA